MLVSAVITHSLVLHTARQGEAYAYREPLGRQVLIMKRWQLGDISHRARYCNSQI